MNFKKIKSEEIQYLSYGSFMVLTFCLILMRKNAQK